jgi:hypothetical protein
MMALDHPRFGRVPPLLPPAADDPCGARARTVAGFAEYLAEDVRQHPERRGDAIAALAHWCDGDRLLLARARAEALRDADLAPHAETLELLRLAARAA